MTKGTGGKTDGFVQRVHRLVAQVPKGKVTTYKDVAHALGTGAYRAVGQAMRKSPGMPTVPCHRVIASDGTLGGFFGERDGHAVERKAAMLRAEGITITDEKVDDLGRRRHAF